MQDSVVSGGRSTSVVTHHSLCDPNKKPPQHAFLELKHNHYGGL
jgi:hypothetical protein